MVEYRVPLSNSSSNNYVHKSIYIILVESYFNIIMVMMCIIIIINRLAPNFLVFRGLASNLEN